MADKELCVREIPNGLVVAVGRIDKKVVTEAAGFVISHAAGEWGMQTYTAVRPAPTHNEIAQLAYCLYESRGRQDGHDIEDWLAAERQLVRQRDQKS